MQHTADPQKNPTAQKPDRRIQRTQHLLRETLVALILEKGYDAITVQDILDRANIGRSTFYAHYRDKDELLMSGFQALFALFQGDYLQAATPGADPAQASRDISLFFFRHAASHHGLYRAMIGEKGGRVILERMKLFLTQLVREHLTAQLAGRGKDVPVDAIAHYLAGSYLALLTWWLDHDLPCSAEEMDALFQRLVFPGIREILG